MTGPNATQALQREDRSDFEEVLRQALNAAEIRAALRNGSAEGPGLEELHSQALADAASIAAAAAAEYRDYVQLRAAARPSALSEETSEATTGNGPGGRGLLPALAVLTPVLATTATAVFLLLGYLMGLSDSQQRLADTLLTAAWTTAVIAAVTTVSGVVWLFTTAARHRTTPPERQHERVAAARGVWRRALLERGVLPYLRERLPRNGPTRPPEPARRPRLGYSSPDFAAPDYASPDYASPDYASPDYATPDRAHPDRAKPDRAKPDRAKPDYASPDFSSPDYASPDFSVRRSSGED
ncbi:hypothetical protein AB0H07_34785 [Streptomyces sp. NPDC021354]|uniref:hypothetical protein n=1 Tax=Streptomyces sp. NPDC021354 TaxID=3154793 RepID=UPI0033FA41A9